MKTKLFESGVCEQHDKHDIPEFCLGLVFFFFFFEILATLRYFVCDNVFKQKISFLQIQNPLSLIFFF